MYSTCLFCNSSLDSNESIEHFPVGRRLAFDAAKGRLWAVCRKCARWNLSPLEERWEAIEEAERAYRDTKKRVATDNIGLARLSDGTELVRIGKPMLPEFAAWRYGDQFGRRRRNRLILGASAVVVGSAVLTGIASVISPFTLMTYAGLGASQLFQHWNFGFRRLTLADTNGAPLKLTGLSLSACIVSFIPETSATSSSLRLLVSHQRPKEPGGFTLSPRKRGRDMVLRRANANFEGREAERVLGVMLAALNGFSGTNSDVKAAVARVENAPTANQLLGMMSDDDVARARKRIQHPFETATRNIMLLNDMPSSLRLALEMSLNEESERRALDGELAKLETRWRQAEEIAAISDGLLISNNTDKKIDAMRD